MSNFSVINNLGALTSRNEAEIHNANLQKTLFRLSSGLRIRTGADDAAGLAIADGLKAQVRTLQQSVRNANDGIGFIQTADAALAEISNLLTRAAQLLTQAASDTNSEQLSSIETELAQIYREIDRIGSATNFNGVSVFSGDTTNVFVGDAKNTANATIGFTSDELSTSELSLTTGVSNSGETIEVSIGTNATTMLDEVSAALDTVANRRGELGAAINRLENSVRVMQSQIQNLTAAESQIRDANMAEEVTNLTRLQILSQTALAGMAQANQNAQSILALFR